MTQLPSDPLELAVLLYHNLANRQLEGRNVTGTLADDFDFQTVVIALENTELLVSEDASTHKIEFHLPGKSTGAFYLTMDELLGSAERRIKTQKRFYLEEFNCICEDGKTVPELVKQYFDTARLFRLLEGIADHISTGDGTTKLFFLLKEKLVITPDYGVNDLKNLINLDSFEQEFITTTTHKEQKNTILRSVLLEIFKGASNVPLSALINEFDDFFQRLRASYDLYVAEFSYEKVKAEVEKDKLEFITKLNKVFSDIQNQLLAVPAALVLVGGQMEMKNVWAAKNLLIWFGALTFSILMDLLIRNQRHTLQAIKQEVDQQWLQIEGKYNSVADRFRCSYQDLIKRYRHQEWLISTVSTLVAISLGVTTSMLLWFSVPMELGLQALEFGLLASLPFVVWDIASWIWQRRKKAQSKIQSTR